MTHAIFDHLGYGHFEALIDSNGNLMLIGSEEPNVLSLRISIFLSERCRGSKRRDYNLTCVTVHCPGICTISLHSICISTASLTFFGIYTQISTQIFSN